MKRLFSSIVCLALLTSTTRAVANADDPPPPPQMPLQRLIERFTRLVPRDVEEKLQLTEAQKKEVGKLQKQLDEKNLKIVMQVVGEISNLQEALEKAQKDNNADVLRSLALAFVASATDINRLRSDLNTKLRAVLDDDQKKTYDDLMKERERERPRIRRRPNS